MKIKKQIGRRAIIIVTFMVMLISTQLVFAASSWSDCGTWSLESGSSYSTKTTTGAKLGANKTTDVAKWSVYTVSKTMYTSPSAKLVNSSDATRSDVVTTASKGTSVTGSENTGTVGYAEYLSVKPSVLQWGTDTIKLQFKNY